MKLYRPLQNRSIYNRYIPGSDCTPTLMGVGDTRFSMEKMAEVVENNVEQGQFLAQKLKGKDLASTSQNIHTFLYNNFQYLADDSDQMLRSLSCSWLERETGIDCKSYSIAASTILSNLGISHAFRRVKQPSWLPTQYTHVYVIVYNNQQSLDENDGYFVIDGTLPTTDEVNYLESDDLQMILRGLGFVNETINLLIGDDKKNNLSKLTKLFGDLGPQINNIKNAIAKVGFWKSFSCNKSAFDDITLERNLNQQVQLMSIIVKDINTAIVSYLNAPKPLTENYNPVGEALQYAYTRMFAVHSGIHGYRHNTSWSSACTKANLEIAYNFALNTLLLKFHDKVLIPYLLNYFDDQLLPVVTINWNECRDTGVGEVCCTSPGGTCPYYKPNVGTYTPHKFTLKQGITQIPALEFTPPVIDALKNNTNNISIQDIIGGVKTFFTITGIGSGPTSGTGNSIDVGNGTGTGANNNLIDPPKTKLFSTSNILIGGTIIATLIYQFKKK